jgi:tetratricopeptide (TPR) repeat protein
MTNDRQMTFSENSFINLLNEGYSLMREGNFFEAVKGLEDLMNKDPDFPGVIDAYRTARFWYNRVDELNSIPSGKRKADFLMSEWAVYDNYAQENKAYNSNAYKSIMTYVFSMASENYRDAFVKQEESTDNFDLLLNLGNCFLRLGEYQKAVDTLEYVGKSYNSNARLLSILAEANYHLGETTKSLWYFREAFFIDPSEINLDLIKAEPVKRLYDIALQKCSSAIDPKEWIPVFGFIYDIFYVRKNLQERQVDIIKDDLYRLEINFQQMNKDQIETSNVLPRLLNRYLWLLDYYEFQNYSYENITQIKARLMNIDPNLFEEYFTKNKLK